MPELNDLPGIPYGLTKSHLPESNICGKNTLMVPASNITQNIIILKL